LQEARPPPAHRWVGGGFFPFDLHLCRQKIGKKTDAPVWFREVERDDKMTSAKEMGRLAGRGLALSGSALATALAQGAASAGVPSALLTSTVKAATLFAAGQAATAGVISAPVATLTEGVLKTMFLTKLKIAVAVLLLTVFVLGGVGILAHPAASAGQQDKKDPPPQPVVKDADKPAGDKEKIQGTWEVVSAEYRGETRENKFTVSFAGNKIALREKAVLAEGVFELDPAKEPKTIDWSLGEFKPQKCLGIYKLEGDKLSLSLGDSDHRPKVFFTEETSIHGTYVLRRIPPKDAENPKTDEEKQKEARLRCGGMMRQIAEAMHEYHDEHNHFPRPAIYSKDGKPLLSWRVALLPQLGQGELYKQFKLDEPWDSQHNKKLLAKMPKVYAPLGEAPKEPHSTFYQVFVGNGAAFEEKADISVKGIADGTVNTILVVEAGNAVPWSKPADLPYDPDKKLPEMGGMLRDGLFTFVTADACVRVTKNPLDEKVMHALITRGGGELIDLENLDP
jgi:uncharacterized protein (TIGR03067 family)